MSTFEVKVRKIDAVEKHPNADKLTINKIGGYTCISNLKEDGTPRYAVGDLVVYIPESAIVPTWILKNMRFWNDAENKGMLSGPEGNRVKGLKLRGVYSEGILMPINYSEKLNKHYISTWSNELYVKEGDDLALSLGIEKYEPPIPVHMAGQVFSAPEWAYNFDVEPIEKNPDAFVGQKVCITEKLHGTFCAIHILPGWTHENAFESPWGERSILVTSKGMYKQGLFFKDVPENENNLYVRAMKKTLNDQFWKRFADLQNEIYALDQRKTLRIALFGEIIGKGVQDLDYSKSDIEFRAFAFQGADLKLRSGCDLFGTVHLLFDSSQIVPVLYENMWIPELIEMFRDGKSAIDNKTLKEGIVISTITGASKSIFSLKSVSPDYKTRKGGTEYN